MAIPGAVAIAVALAACVADLRSRRIPNVLTLGASAGAVVFFAATTGWPGVVFSVSGWIVGLALLLPLFLLRGLGGGDVKLIAGLGAWLGPGAVVWLVLWTAVAALPLALVVAARHRYTRKAFENVWALLNFWRVMGLRPHPSITLDAASPRGLPYALPILVAAVITVWRSRG